MKEKKIFCKKCGHELIKNPDVEWNWVKRAEYLNKYDSNTGNLIDYSGFSYKCPNNKFFSYGHDYFFLRNR